MVKILGTISARLGKGEWRENAPTGPTARPDFTTATAGGNIRDIDPLPNDEDPAGGGLTLVDVQLDADSVADGGAVSANNNRIAFLPPESARTSIITYSVRDANGLEDESTVEVDVFPAPQAGDISVSILTNRPEQSGRAVGTAPMGIFFRAIVEGTNGDPNFSAYTDLDYKWTFADPGYFTAHLAAGEPEGLPWDRVYRLANDDVVICRGTEVWSEDGSTILSNDAVLGPQGYQPAGGGTFLGNDKNLAYGPDVSHVFADLDFAGQPYRDFPVRCEVRSSATEQSLVTVTKVVRVSNPDSVFSGNKTILVSKTGNRNDANDAEWLPSTYPGAQRCNAIAQAMAAHDDFGSHSNIRVLLRRGQNFSTEGFGGTPAKRQKYFIGSYGSGPKARIGTSDEHANKAFDMHSTPSNIDATEFAYFGLEIDGPYDPENPHGLSGDHSVFNGFYVEGGRNKTIWDCDVTGCWGAINGSSNQMSIYGPGYQNLIIGNSYVGNWVDYGCYSNKNPNYHGQCGNWLTQAAGVVHGNSRNTSWGPPIYARHGPLRCTAPGSPTSFRMMRIRSLGGWSSGHQPCNRWLIKPIEGDHPNPGDIPAVNWDRAYGEGGSLIRQPLSSASSGETGDGNYYPVNYLFDKCYNVTYSQTTAFAKISGGAIRSSVMMMADQENFAGGIASTVVSATTSAFGVPLPVDDRFRDLGLGIYNCTIVDYRSGSIGGWEGFVNETNVGAYAYTDIENNIYHAPNRTDLSADANLDESTLIDLDFPGRRAEEQGQPYTVDATYAVNHDAPLFLPLSPENATGRVAIRDFFGRLNVSPKKGAVQP
jgi:hypothetical protein